MAKTPKPEITAKAYDVDKLEGRQRLIGETIVAGARLTTGLTHGELVLTLVSIMATHAARSARHFEEADDLLAWLAEEAHKAREPVARMIRDADADRHAARSAQEALDAIVKKAGDFAPRGGRGNA